MKVLMISMDRGLLGKNPLGDVVERHRAYGREPGVERLDIVVFSRKGFTTATVSNTVTVYPTNSVSKLLYLTDAVKMADELYKKQVYDLVVTQDPFFTGLVGAHMKRKYGSSLLVHFHGDFLENPFWKAESPLNRIALKFGKGIINQADSIRVVSRGIAEKLHGYGVASEKIRVIPTPVDVGKFARIGSEAGKNFRNTYGIGSSKMLLNVGRNDPSKDYSTLYNIMREVVARYQNPVCLVQCGAGLSREEVMKKIQAPAERLQVVTLGLLPHDELVSAYQAADVYVSSSRHESFGKVLVEANAAGLPVVATATTGSQDIVDPGVNGYLAPVGDAAKLAEHIVHLLENPELAQVMGERGQRLVAERFDGNKNIKAVVQYWRDILA